MLKIFGTNKKSSNSDDGLKIDFNRLPNHIAIIMDGNGRWAEERNLPRNAGHKAGVEAVRNIVKECSKLGIKYLTLYGFSTENWGRPKDEVSYLMRLLAEYLKKEFDELNENNVIINNIGDISKLPVLCQNELASSYEKTKNNTGLVLNLAFNYGGRDEITKAIREIASDVQNGVIKVQDIDQKLISTHMYTKNMPDPDLIIRPSGELRLSNFLLWQCAYSEFWFSDIYWPDFNVDELHKAIYDYQNRDRRFGKVK